MKKYSGQCWFEQKIVSKLNRLIIGLDFLTKEVSVMSIELDNLVRQVGETQDIEQSVVTLLEGIKLQLETVIAELEEAGVDTATLVALHDDLDASEQALASAVAAFTPTEPPVVE